MSRRCPGRRLPPLCLPPRHRRRARRLHRQRYRRRHHRDRRSAATIDAFLAAPASQSTAAGAHRFRDCPSAGADRRNGFPDYFQPGQRPGRTGIPADAATCADCLRELLDPATAAIATHSPTAPTAARASPSRAASPMTGRRPRWRSSRCARPARPNTTIRSNRRFHAQPNACWDCGPRLWLEAPDGSPIPANDPVAVNDRTPARRRNRRPSKASAAFI